MITRTENLHEALASLGLASRPTANRVRQGREVYRPATGEELGTLDAKDGWELVERLRAEREAA